MPLKTIRDDSTSINLTPMIDVVFLLIIFFMVGTRFSELEEAEKDISLRVPQVSDAKALTDRPNRHIINVYQDGSISLDREAVSLQQLGQRLIEAKHQYQDLGVVVRGDANSLYQYVADVISTCRQSDITDLNIAVKPASPSEDGGAARRESTITR